MTKKKINFFKSKGNLVKTSFKNNSTTPMINDMIQMQHHIMKPKKACVFFEHAKYLYEYLHLIQPSFSCSFFFLVKQNEGTMLKVLDITMTHHQARQGSQIGGFRPPIGPSQGP